MQKMRIGVMGLAVMGLWLATGSALAEQRGGAMETADKPEVFVQTGHSLPAVSLGISHDGKYVVSGSADGGVVLWDVKSGRQIRRFSVPNIVGWVQFSKDDREILIGSENGRVTIYDLVLGKELRTVIQNPENEQGIHEGNIAITSDGTHAVSVPNPFMEDGLLKYWNLRDGRKETSFQGQGKPGSGVSALALTRNDQFVLAGSAGPSIEMFEISSGRLVRRFENSKLNKEDAFFSVEMSRDGIYVLAGATTGEVTWWETKTGRDLRSVKAHPGAVNVLVVSPNGQYVLSGSFEDTKFNLWELSTGKLIKSFSHIKDGVRTAIFSPDGQYVLSSDQHSNIYLWKLHTGEIIQSFKKHGEHALSLGVRSDERNILVGYSDGAVRTWDAEAGQLVSILQGPTDGGVIHLSRTGRYAVTGSRLGKIVVWDVESRREIKRLKEQEAWDVIISPNEKYGVTILANNTLQYWEIETGRQISEAKVPFKTGFNSAVFSPDNMHVIFFGDLHVKKVDLKTGQQSFDYGPLSIGALGQPVASSPDGKFIVAGTIRGDIYIIDSKASTAKIVSDERNRSVTSIAFSRDSAYMFIGLSDGTISMRETEAGQQVRLFSGHSQAAEEIFILKDGRRLISASSDATTRIFDIATGHELISAIGASGDDWISITPKGYFTSSKNGARYLNVRISNQVYGIDNFFEQFYRPDVVAEVLRTDESDAAVLTKLGEKEGVNLAQAVKLPPAVQFLSPKPGDSFDKDEVEVQVQATDQGGGVDEVRLYHNGKIVGADTRDLKVTAKASSGTDLTKAYRVRLVDGTNVFKAVALSKDRIESNPDELTIHLKAVGKPATLHLLLVGINEYKNPALNLNFALPDAQGVQKFFTSAPSILFKEVKRYELYDKAATKTAIVTKLKDLEATAPQDVVVIYLAGHGESLENTWYFIPYEIVTPEKEDQVKQQGLSSTELKDHVAKIGAQKVLVLIDACKSGSAMGAFAARGVEDRKAMAQLARSTGTHVVAASTKDQFAAEVKALGHGVFTYTLLDGLSGKADASKDGTVTVRELLTYVESRLPEVSEKYKQQAQYPVVDSRGQDFPLATVR